MDFEELFPYLLSKEYTDQVAVQQEGSIEEALEEAKAYADSISSKIEWKKEIVETLPEDPDQHTIYFVPASITPEKDGYIEYMYLVNSEGYGKWEVIGQTTAEYTIDNETLQLENNVLSIRVIPEELINSLFNN